MTARGFRGISSLRSGIPRPLAVKAATLLILLQKNQKNENDQNHIDTDFRQLQKQQKNLGGRAGGKTVFLKITTKKSNMRSTQLARLMRLSWEIQRVKHRSRSRSLSAAWAIFLNEDITIYYLIRKHGHSRRPDKLKPSQITLFP